MSDRRCHDGMPYDSIQSQGQGQGHEGLECAKMADFNGYLLRQYAYNQKANAECYMILQDNI